jgi:hypothetical protein
MVKLRKFRSRLLGSKTRTCFPKIQTSPSLIIPLIGDILTLESITGVKIL